MINYNRMNISLHQKIVSAVKLSFQLKRPEDNSKLTNCKKI